MCVYKLVSFLLYDVILYPMTVSFDKPGISITVTYIDPRVFSLFQEVLIIEEQLFSVS